MMRNEMTPQALEAYLHDHIPLTRAMQVGVVAIETGAIVLGAPLAPNVNHRATAFGGSVSALAILAAWSLVHVRLAAEDLSPRLVIQRNTMAYDLPIAGDFTARASLAPDVDWPRFTRTLARKGLARIAVRSVLAFEGRTAGRFDGEFVALAAPPSKPVGPIA